MARLRAGLVDHFLVTGTGKMIIDKSRTICQGDFDYFLVPTSWNGVAVASRDCLLPRKNGPLRHSYPKHTGSWDEQNQRPNPGNALVFDPAWHMRPGRSGCREVPVHNVALCLRTNEPRRALVETLNTQKGMCLIGGSNENLKHLQIETPVSMASREAQQKSFMQKQSRMLPGSPKSAERFRNE